MASDDFAGGLTQESKLNVVGCNNPQPRYDSGDIFNVKNPPDILKLSLQWPYRDRGKGSSDD